MFLIKWVVSVQSIVSYMLNMCSVTPDAQFSKDLF